MSDKIQDRLWELRLEAVGACERLLESRSIKANADKISGYTDTGILMQPEAMQQVINVLEHARQSNEMIQDFGRSQLKQKNAEADEESQVEGALARFGRSVNTTEPSLSAAEKVEKQQTKKSKNPEEQEFSEAMKRLEDFMQKHGLEHPMPCRSKKLEKEDIDRMNEEIGDFDYDEEADRIKATQRVRALASKTLFEFCDKKPFQCLVCPYYYRDFPEFWDMKERRKNEGRTG